MGTPVRAAATLHVDSVTLGPDQFRVEVALQNVELELLDSDVQTSVAMLIKSGALDLSRPANLIAHLPQRPELIVEAEGERVVLDLMQLPQFGRTGAVKRWMPVVAHLCAVKSLRIKDGFVELEFRILPGGVATLRKRWRRT